MSSSASIRQRLAIVSDLHMATGQAPGGDPFADDRAFAGLVDALAAADIPTRLVLLGDTFDLVLAGPGGLDAVAAAHPGVLRALGAFSAAGHTVELVPGNHDIDLLRPAAQQRLRELVGAAVGDRAAGARIGFRPWVVHVPGVLYAEHGQQHHAINHFRCVLGRSAPARLRGGAPPPGLCLDQARVRCGRLRERHPGAPRAALRGAALAAGAVRACAGALLAGSRASRQRHVRGVREQALALGLPGEVLLEVDRRATPTALDIARRARGGDFMLAAARSVCEVLADAGAETAFCVFGHTHVADDRPLSERADRPRYLNAGTWSSMLRRGRDRADDRRRWVEIQHGGELAPTAALRRWEPAHDPDELLEVIHS